MQSPVLTLTLVLGIVIWPARGNTAPTAQDIITLARQQLTVPAEFVLGEMKVYRGEKLNRFYSFVMGKLWEAETQTESVRLDFKTAVNSSIDSSLYSDQRYLLRRSPQAPATQWLYLPGLRRVRLIPHQPNDPLLQSDYLFYDLTTILDFGDYRYRLIDTNEQSPIIEGEPLDAAGPVPYEKAIFHLEKRGETYLVTEVQYSARGKEKLARFLAFDEIAPGCYRPQQLVVTGEGGRTEFSFHHWAFRAPEPRLLTPALLETRTLAFPATAP